MILETRAAPPFFKNGFVVGCEDTREAVVIDPGDEVGELLSAVERQQARPIRYILLTHAHIDHITGVGAAKKALGAPSGCTGTTTFSTTAWCSRDRCSGCRPSASPRSIFSMNGPGPWRFGNYGAWVHHTPGHCPGGVCLAVGRDGERTRTLFVGDTLFAGSIGRTDLPGGDHATLLRSIREVLFTFPDDTVVYSGPRRAHDNRHGEADEPVPDAER